MKGRHTRFHRSVLVHLPQQHPPSSVFSAAVDIKVHKAFVFRASSGMIKRLFNVNHAPACGGGEKSLSGTVASMSKMKNRRASFR